MVEAKYPKPNFFEDNNPPPVDKKNKATIELSEALGMQEGDVAVFIMEKSETGGLLTEQVVVSKAYVHSPPNTLRTKAADLVNTFLKKRQGVK